MANIKSAKKRVLVNQTKALRNKMIKSGVKTAVKKVDAAIAAGDKEAALNKFKDIQKNIDQAVSKGLIKNNTADRQKARLNLKVKNMK